MRYFCPNTTFVILFEPCWRYIPGKNFWMGPWYGALCKHFDGPWVGVQRPANTQIFFPMAHKKMNNPKYPLASLLVFPPTPGPCPLYLGRPGVWLCPPFCPFPGRHRFFCSLPCWRPPKIGPLRLLFGPPRLNCVAPNK